MALHIKRFAAALALLIGSLIAMPTWADAEPSLNQVYASAEAGKLDEAQLMMQQVLIAHPRSAKAHFVRAELFARQGKLSQAREALAEAEAIAPGLPFAKPEAVRALRSELEGAHPRALPAGAAYAATAASPVTFGASWVLPLLLAGAVIIVAYLVFRRRVPPASPSYTMAGAISQPGYSGGAYGQAVPTYGQPTGTGLGGQIMGGVATGLAVGAGVVAAEAIGRRILGDGESHPHQADTMTTPSTEPAYDANPDMGGQTFGINDASSWDDAGSGSDGGGWDN